MVWKVGGCVALVLLVLFAGLLVWTYPHDIGTAATPDASSVWGLPNTATDIHWFMPGHGAPLTTFDFKVSRTGFDKWLADQRDELTGPHFGRFTITTYSEKTSSFEQRVIPNAVAYTWSEEDRGTQIAYDLDAERAYYYHHSR